jgi:hypothetical protein
MRVVKLVRQHFRFSKRPSRRTGSPSSAPAALLLLQTPAHHNLLLLTTMLELHRTYCPTIPFLPPLFSCTLWHIPLTFPPLAASRPWEHPFHFDVCSFGNELDANEPKRTETNGCRTGAYDSESCKPGTFIAIRECPWTIPKASL